MQLPSEQIVIKLEYHGTIKRTRNVPSTLEELRKLILESFPELAAVPVAVSYKDKEEDVISLSTEEDLQEAYLQLKEDGKNIIKFFVRKLREQGQKDESAPRTSNYSALQNPFVEETKGMAEINERMGTTRISEEPLITQSTMEDLPIHRGIICDGCEMTPLRGDRYKCIVCASYDLCSGCKAKGVHAEHSFMKINPHDGQVNNSQVIEMDITPESFPGILHSLRNFYGSRGRPFHARGHCGMRRGFWGGHHRGRWGRYWEGCGGQWRKAKKMAAVVGGREKRCVKIKSAPELICEAQWQLKNESQEPWPARVTVNKKEGNVDFEPVLIQGGFQPGETINLNIPIAAPRNPGEYVLKLVLNAEEGYQIGKCLKVHLMVEGTDPGFDMEEVVSINAHDMQKAGFGTFEQCYDALMAEKGNVEAAKTRCMKQ
eukprot:TRINITY_DN222_c0_g1_i13.p1 TRINITY_DN222_c0_g1~~TRINITY_DN222_c0_g1_i13.p1  ORF type:complete len:430 (+),score=141.74 TRINITY_DN222_c0_g1_i13:327-1616(+)